MYTLYRNAVVIMFENKVHANSHANVHSMFSIMQEICFLGHSNYLWWYGKIGENFLLNIEV